MSGLPTCRAFYSRYPDNLTEQDQRTYRRWVRGLLAFYLVVIGVAVAASFTYRLAGNLTASNEGARHLTAARSASGFGTSVAAEKR
jgi:hypothetical protein